MLFWKLKPIKTIQTKHEIYKHVLLNDISNLNYHINICFLKKSSAISTYLYL